MGRVRVYAGHHVAALEFVLQTACSTVPVVFVGGKVLFYPFSFTAGKQGSLCESKGGFELSVVQQFCRRL